MHLEPWQSWVVVTLVAAGGYAYYSRTGTQRRRRGRALNFQQQRAAQRRGSSTEASSNSNNTRKKGQPKMAGDFDDDDFVEPASLSKPATTGKKAKNRKNGSKKANQRAQSSAVDIAAQQEPDEDVDEAQEGDLDDREFAKQMNGVKTGAAISKPEASRNKNKKQGKQAELPLNSYNALSPDANALSSSKDLSNASSTTGADADDDLSPVASPPLTATPTMASGDVSDMLEAPGKGPSVLRFTGTEEAKRPPKPQKAVQEAETKKQRQNRRKNEEKKLAREEAERERRVLLEKQLRTAREAEGRPAKNGVGAAPTTNAWNNPSTNNVMSSQQSSSTPGGSLLDTFENSTKPATNGHHDESKNAPAKNANVLGGEIPSEEEQLRILNELEGSGGWNTVQKGGKSKKKNAANGKENERQMSKASATMSGTDGNSTATTSDDAIGQPTPSQSQTEDEKPKPSETQKEDLDTTVWDQSNIHLHPEYDSRVPYALTGHPDDSDWAVV
ncbi:MAG: hypothetical protein LQ352_005040 [Teloschistes flavicans]|nr:MAG: hypothetical protein LQ352_005040 [Teloschistes flavicans]